MNRTLFFAVAPVMAVAGLAGFVSKPVAPVVQSAADGQTEAVVVAARAFINSLSVEQQKAVQFPSAVQPKATAATFTGSRGGGRGDQGARGGTDRGGNRGDAGRGGPGGGMFGGFVGEQYGQAVWSNFPVSDVPRPGVTIGSLSADQRTSAIHLLQVLLSDKGYQKVLDIMGSDQALADGGTQFSSGTAFYTLGIFGTPSTSAPWMLQFGGHHLGLNLTIVGAHGVITPTLTGAQPAVYTANGKTIRVLAQENDKAFTLLNALDAAQQRQAMLNYRIGDLVFGPGQDGKTIAPEGLKASLMTDAQRAMLIDLIAEWAGIVNDVYAAGRLSEIKAGLPDTYFAWSGPATHDANRNGTAYYRIQGPKLLIEFSPQGVGGDPTMHVHTMYRDPTNDYGRAFISR